MESFRGFSPKVRGPGALEEFFVGSLVKEFFENEAPRDPLVCYKGICKIRVNKQQNRTNQKLNHENHF